MKDYPQLPLPGVSLAPHSDMDTSLAAARAITPHLGRLEAVVLAALRAAGQHGLCDHEGMAVTGLGPNTYRPRRVALEMRGLVRDSGLRRKTLAGRYAVAWVATGQIFTT